MDSKKFNKSLNTVDIINDETSGDFRKFVNIDGQFSSYVLRDCIDNTLEVRVYGKDGKLPLNNEIIRQEDENNPYSTKNLVCIYNEKDELEYYQTKYCKTVIATLELVENWENELKTYYDNDIPVRLMGILCFLKMKITDNVPTVHIDDFDWSMLPNWCKYITFDNYSYCASVYEYKPYLREGADTWTIAYDVDFDFDTSLGIKLITDDYTKIYKRPEGIEYKPSEATITLVEKRTVKVQFRDDLGIGDNIYKTKTGVYVNDNIFNRDMDDDVYNKDIKTMFRFQDYEMNPLFWDVEECNELVNV